MTAEYACCGHDIYMGNDMHDAECCICGDNPCGSVDVERMRKHRLWDLERERLFVGAGVSDEPPF